MRQTNNVQDGSIFVFKSGLLQVITLEGIDEPYTTLYEVGYQMTNICPRTYSTLNFSLHFTSVKYLIENELYSVEIAYLRV